jgi:excisionase family DNA binding protein
MTVKQMCELLTLHAKTIQKWAREGRIPHRRVEFAHKFDRQRIADWIRDRELSLKEFPNLRALSRLKAGDYFFNRFKKIVTIISRDHLTVVNSRSSCST